MKPMTSRDHLRSKTQKPSGRFGAICNALQFVGVAASSVAAGSVAASSAFAVASLVAATPAIATPAMFDNAIDRYRSYLAQDIDGTVVSVKEMHDRLAVDDLDGAKRAWLASRIGWERSEVFTGVFAPELDRDIDAWPDGVKGFHAVEAKLFGARKTDVQPEVGALLASLSELATTIRETKLTAQGLLNGLARLTYEVGESKIDGGESRVSGTSLDDMRNNLHGISAAYHILFASTIEDRDHDLSASALRQIDELNAILAENDLRKIDPERLRVASEELVITLQNAAPLLELDRPTLEESPPQQ
jgi:iron uptake system component EfeO